MLVGRTDIEAGNEEKRRKERKEGKKGTRTDVVTGAIYFSACNARRSARVACNRDEGVSALAEGLFEIRMRDTSAITFM